MKNQIEDHIRIILRLLRTLLRHKGEANAIKADALSESLGVDPRQIAEFAGLLTQEGYWVCSGIGYWYAESKQQWIDRQLGKERGRAIEILKKVHHAEKNSVDELSLFETAA